VEVIEIILGNIVQLEEQFIILRSYVIIYSTLQKITLLDTNIYGITKDQACTY
jgi:hypothetical protein